MIPLAVWAEWNPAKTSRMVNDYAGLLSEYQRQELELRLEAFSDSTSNQIVIITTHTLEGEDENVVAQRIGQAWGVGGKAHNNGMIILILDSETEGHAAAISTGYGLEGAFPDLFCKRILEDEMVPHFRDDNDYYAGLCAGLDVILPVAAGEYSFAEYETDGRRETIIFVIVMIIIFVVVIIVSSKANKNSGGGSGNHTSGGGPIFMSGSPWGSGSSSFGGFGGSGGFGGFGGGSFGGGGSSSRW